VLHAFTSMDAVFATAMVFAVWLLIRAFEPLRYDKDSGPLRFVTLRQLATAYGR